MSINRQSAFVLPTILVLSIVLLTLGLSVFQLTSGIARSLTDQYWQRLSSQAAYAGANYASFCVDSGLSIGTWPTTITQSTDCLGATLGSVANIHTNTSDTGPSPNRFSSKFSIARPTTNSDGIAKSTIIGKVVLLNSSGGAIRTYTTTITAMPYGLERFFTKVDSSDIHTCAVTNGQAFCWGGNASGQLGTGDTTTGNAPVAVKASLSGDVLFGKTITSISAGANHTCAIADGKAYCWGYNLYGQLGDSTSTDRLVPVAVTGGSVLAGKTITSISAGANHTCAVADGQAYCWGRDNYGQLGNGTTTDSLVPVLISGGSLAGKIVTSISAGMEHTCAVADGKAHCWGKNTYGQLGDSTSTNRLVPVAVKASVSGDVLFGKTITSISAGMDHTCAVANGQAYCWGRDNYGQLGDGTPATDSLVPVLVSDGAFINKPITSVSAGANHTCVISNGEAWCWGRGTYGQIGDGGNSNINYAAMRVWTNDALKDKSLSEVSAGDGHTCAVANGLIYCWGLNSSGQLGNYSNLDSAMPIKTISTF